MADYRVLYTDLVSGSLLGELPVREVSFSHALNSPGSFSATLPLDPSVQSEDIPVTYQDSILAEAPIGFWRLDDQDGDQMEDYSGFGRHGSYEATPTYRVNGPDLSRIPRAMDFDSNVDYAIVDSSTAEPFQFQGNVPFSVEFWVRIASTPTNWRRYLSLDDNSNGWWFLNDSSGKVRFYRTVGGSFKSVIDTTALSTNEWHHIAGTYDGESTIKLYVDGELVDSDTGATAAMTGNEFPLTINTQASSRAVMAGCRMAALAIYDRELSADEIALRPRLGSGEVVETEPGPRIQTITPGSINPASNGIYIERDGVIQWGGILWTTQADVGSNTLTLAGEGFLSYFRRRVIRANLVYSDEYQENIAAALIEHAQNVSGGDISVSTSTVSDGFLRDRTYLADERKSVGEALEQLAAVNEGFDFAFSSSWNADEIETSFVTTYPNTGRVTEHVFEMGSNVSLLSQARDGTLVVTSSEAIGAGLADEAIIELASDEGMHSTYPRLEEVQTFTDIRYRSTLQAHASLRLQRGSEPVQTIRLNVFSDTVPKLGSYVVGDLVRVRGEHGLVSVDGTFRIMEIGVSVSTDGTEGVSMSLVPKELF